MAARWTVFSFVPVCSQESPMAWPCRTRKAALALATDLHSTHTSSWVTRFDGRRQETVASFPADSLAISQDEEENLIASLERDTQGWRDAGYDERPIYA